MTVQFRATIEELQEAQDANLRIIAALEPAGAEIGRARPSAGEAGQGIRMGGILCLARIVFRMPCPYGG